MDEILVWLYPWRIIHCSTWMNNLFLYGYIIVHCGDGYEKLYIMVIDDIFRLRISCMVIDSTLVAYS